MKPGIHPKYTKTVVTCSCGSTLETRSVMGDKLSVEICSDCHPFFTGKQKIIDTAGRIEKFQRKYADVGKVKKVIKKAATAKA